MSLRNNSNAKMIVSAGGHNIIVKAMHIHHARASVVKQACSAIRNIVARNPELREVSPSHEIKRGKWRMLTL